MNRLKTKQLYLGFSLTPIIATLAFILSLCLGLNYIVELNQEVNLECYADTYNRLGEAQGVLKLDVQRRGKDIELEFSYVWNHEKLAKIHARGQLLALATSTMSYELLMEDSLPRWDVVRDEEAVNMDESLKLVRNILSDADGNLHYIKVLEMNKRLRYVALQLSSNNGIWACEIK